MGLPCYEIKLAFEWKTSVYLQHSKLELEVLVFDSQVVGRYISLTTQVCMDHFTVVAELPGLWLEARLPVTLF